jgi:AcrR family transcriptional regulator
MTTAENATSTVEPDLSSIPGNGAPARAVDWENPRVAAILSAAAKCFARKGFTATTLAEIGKELGLRKSIVHYYFASKAALIHEVQSFSYHRYLERVKDAIKSHTGTPAERSRNALMALWEAIHNNKTGLGLNIEVWSASRRDPELKRRAIVLQKDARKLVSEAVADVLGVTPEQFPALEATSTLILSVLNGLSISEYLEGDEGKTKEAYDQFLYLMGLAIKAINKGS